MMEQPKIPMEIAEVDPMALSVSVKSFAPLSERQGVFIHLFKCLDCSLGTSETIKFHS